MTSTEAGLKCPSCHYQIDTLTSDRCPECGQRFEIVSPLLTVTGPATRDWRYWAGMGGWAVAVMIYLAAMFTESIILFNIGTGFMLSVLTCVVIGKR